MPIAPLSVSVHQGTRDERRHNDCCTANSPKSEHPVRQSKACEKSQHSADERERQSRKHGMGFLSSAKAFCDGAPAKLQEDFAPNLDKKLKKELDQKLNQKLYGVPPQELGVRLLEPQTPAGIRSTSLELPELHTRDMRIPFDIESPGFVLVFAGIVYANPGRGNDSTNLQLAVFDPQGVAIQIGAVEFFVDAHRHAELSGSAADVRLVIGIFPQFLHDRDVIQRFDCADEDGGRIVGRFRDSIQAEVEAVDHVDIGAASVLKHDRRPGSFPFRGVAGQIMRTDVGLGLDDLPREVLASQSPDQNLAEKVPGNFK